jgi:hypothetical protein
MVNAMRSVITKVVTTSVILRFGIHADTTEITYNADLGNGADGRQATATTAPIFWRPIGAGREGSRFRCNPKRLFAHRIRGAAFWPAGW